MAEGMRVLYGSDKKKCNEEFVSGRGYQSPIANRRMRSSTFRDLLGGVSWQNTARMRSRTSPRDDR